MASGESVAIIVRISKGAEMKMKGREAEVKSQSNRGENIRDRAN